jgi:glycosyltransferase involved in cell wall biosynthesis
LEDHGHEVVRYTVHNDAFEGMSRWVAARRSFWNRTTYDELTQLIHARRPALMHCTNTFPLMSPATYSAAKDARIPVIQALRNYRLLCPNAYLMRDGRVCEDCLGKAFKWPAILHACYRDNRAATTTVAAMLAWRRMRRTWRRGVDLYFTLTEFARQKFLEAGFAADQVTVKPNFVAPDPGVGTGAGGYAVFVGRLSPEKGIATLLEAWSLLDGDSDGWPLKIVGDGPLAPLVKASAAGNSRIEWLGPRSLPDTLSIVGNAAALVMPSIWYETFGRTVIEAFATGTPVIASRLGAMAEIVADGRTGLHFEPGGAVDLAGKVRMLKSDPARLAAMRTAARQEYETKYTPEINYRLLMQLYSQV